MTENSKFVPFNKIKLVSFYNLPIAKARKVCYNIDTEIKEVPANGHVIPVAKVKACECVRKDSMTANPNTAVLRVYID